jgi:hypothetical protein
MIAASVAQRLQNHFATPHNHPGTLYQGNAGEGVKSAQECRKDRIGN